MRRLLTTVVAAVGLLATACGASSVQPTPTPTASIVTASPSAAPSTTAAPSPTTLDHAIVYFARDRLPPVGVHLDGAGAGATAEARILSRLGALFTADAPRSRGLFNIALTSKARPTRATVTGDLATVDFSVVGGDWGVAGSAGSRAFIQQIVYTATEEPGIRRVLITENGQQAVIGGEGVVIDHAAAREDVAGYTVKPSTDPMTWRTEPVTTPIAVTSRAFVDLDAPALARFIVETGLRGAAAKSSLGFTASVIANDERAHPELGKWVLSLTVPDATAAEEPLRVVEQTPLRAVRATSGSTGVRYDLALDDLRPWRVAMLYEPLRLVIDVGGDPDAVSANIAMYRPAFGTTVRAGDAISGMIRAFEARYEYRVLDSRGAVVVDEFATASLGTSEMWGTFNVPVPAVPEGGATIEILLRSPRDGSVSESVFTSVVVAR